MSYCEDIWRSDVGWQLSLVTGSGSPKSLNHESLIRHLRSIRRLRLLTPIDGLSHDPLDPLKFGTHVGTCTDKGDGIFETTLSVGVVDEVIGDGVGPLFLSVLLELRWGSTL